MSLGLFAVAIAGLGLAGWHLFHGTPSWYQPWGQDPQQRAAAAQRAESKLLDTRNWAAEAHARQSAAQRASQSHAQSVPATLTAPAPPLTVSFSEEELNGFMEKWAGYSNARGQYEKYISDPSIALRDGRIILAAQVKELRTVASLQFEPCLDAQGQFHVDLVRVLGGNLPMPQAVWSGQLNKLTGLIEEKLPTLQAAASMDRHGATNNSAMGAAMCKLLLHSFNHEAADPVLFLPLLDEPRGVPVKLTAVKIEEGTLTLTVQMLDESQRKTLLERIREPYRAAVPADKQASVDHLTANAQ